MTLIIVIAKAVIAAPGSPYIAVGTAAQNSGKTTLAKQVRVDWKYFDLENINDSDFISSDPDVSDLWVSSSDLHAPRLAQGWVLHPGPYSHSGWLWLIDFLFHHG